MSINSDQLEASFVEWIETNATVSTGRGKVDYFLIKEVEEVLSKYKEKHLSDLEKRLARQDSSSNEQANQL
jgi:hypothetical protein